MRKKKLWFKQIELHITYIYFHAFFITIYVFIRYSPVFSICRIKRPFTFCVRFVFLFQIAQAIGSKYISIFCCSCFCIVINTTHSARLELNWNFSIFDKNYFLLLLFFILRYFGQLFKLCKLCFNKYSKELLPYESYRIGNNNNNNCAEELQQRSDSLAEYRDFSNEFSSMSCSSLLFNEINDTLASVHTCTIKTTSTSIDNSNEPHITTIQHSQNDLLSVRARSPDYSTLADDRLKDDDKQTSTVSSTNASHTTSVIGQHQSADADNHMNEIETRSGLNIHLFIFFVVVSNLIYTHANSIANKLKHNESCVSLNLNLMIHATQRRQPNLTSQCTTNLWKMQIRERIENRTRQQQQQQLKCS